MMKVSKINMKILNFRKIEEKYKRALNGSDIAIWEWNLKNNTLFASEKWEDIIGASTNNFKGLRDFIEKMVFYDDKESAINDLNFYIEGKVFSYKSEYRIVTKNQQVKWIVFRGKLIKDSNEENKVLSGSVYDVTEKKNREEEVSLIAYYDSLTGLPNRTLFLNNFREILKKAIANNKKGALIFIDLDNFKYVNDTFGHDYGDLLLKIFSQLLKVCAKDYGQISRLSGDEFIILIEEFNSVRDLKEICCNILNYCKTPFELREKQAYITASIGICTFPEHSSNVSELLRYVELAMYQSKLNGKNSYTFFQKSMNDSHSREILIEQELKNAIKNHELFLVYQPQINAVKNKIVGLEALLRWKNKKLGWVPPSEFIPIAEKSTMLIEIGDWVLGKVCKKIYQWKIKGYKFNTISVNVSPIQIKADDFIEKIIKVHEENKIPLNLLELEITEGTLMKLNEDKIGELNELIKKGINFSIDDFGTGYSSLNYLTVLPVSTLKIDKSFIDKIEDEKNKAVIDCILNLSKALKYKVIAEGVEMKEQVDLLIQSGCNIIQGYYFSKPVTENEIEIMLNYN